MIVFLFSLLILVILYEQGIEVIVEFPIEDNSQGDSFSSIKLLQKEDSETGEILKAKTDHEIFMNYDRKRKIQNDNICYCPYEMVYIPPETPKTLIKTSDDAFPIEIVEEPPSLTCICQCCGKKAVSREFPSPSRLQFKQLPLKTVRTVIVKLRNVSRVEAQWRATVRRWPRRHTRTIHKEQWSGDVCASGVVVQCEPGRGLVRAGHSAAVSISVYADCWGLYHEQILIQIENLEPLILDVWIEAIGPPLVFALQPSEQQAVPTLWMSISDAERAVFIKNTSRAGFNIYAYILRESLYKQDLLPFRVYLRLYDVSPRACTCSESTLSLIKQDPSMTLSSDECSIGVELFLAADHGVQDGDFYSVQPSKRLVKCGENTDFKVHLIPKRESAPDSLLMLRSTPIEAAGDGWYRPEPQLQFVQLRQAQRFPCLRASRSELKITICAVDIPYEDVIRVRKKLKVQNVGDGPLKCTAVTEPPWRVATARTECDARCVVKGRENVIENIQLYLPPTNFTNMTVEVSVKWSEVYEAPVAPAVPLAVTSSTLRFYDDDKVLLLNIPLLLEIDIPILKVQPEIIDFGEVSDGSTRKSYFTVTHSSALATLDLVTSWIGDEEFRLWPTTLALRPRTCENIYIQYTARWSPKGTASGKVLVTSRGTWSASVLATARPQRCAARAGVLADCTDDHLPSDVDRH